MNKTVEALQNVCCWGWGESRGHFVCLMWCLLSTLPPHRSAMKDGIANNSTASISQARKAVEQLKMEACMDRIKVKPHQTPPTCSPKLPTILLTTTVPSLKPQGLIQLLNPIFIILIPGKSCCLRVPRYPVSRNSGSTVSIAAAGSS